VSVTDAGDRPQTLLVDFGGVLTTSVFRSFDDFSKHIGAERLRRAASRTRART